MTCNNEGISLELILFSSINPGASGHSRQAQPLWLPSLWPLPPLLLHLAGVDSGISPRSCQEMLSSPLIVCAHTHR